MKIELVNCSILQEYAELIYRRIIVNYPSPRLCCEHILCTIHGKMTTNPARAVLFALGEAPWVQSLR
jgi:hypothetical protein